MQSGDAYFVCVRDLRRFCPTQEPTPCAYTHEPVKMSARRARLEQERREEDAIRKFVGAACTGQLDELRRYIDLGAAVDAHLDAQDTAMVAASRQGKSAVVELLLEHSASVNEAGEFGEPPLIAACNGKDAMAVMKLLLDHGASADSTNDYDNPALTYACTKASPEVAKLLLDHNASVNLTNSDGFSALLNACLYNRAAVVKLLLGRNASVDQATRKTGKTALIAASALGHLDVVRLLVEHNASLEMKMKKSDFISNPISLGDSCVNKGDTALIVASRKGSESASRAHIEIVNLLLERNASLDVENAHGNTALEEARDWDEDACKGSDSEVVQLLSERKHLGMCANLGVPPDEFALVASNFTMPASTESAVPLAVLTRHGETPLRAHAVVLAGLGGVLAHHFRPPAGQGGFHAAAPIPTDQEPWSVCKLTTIQVIIGVAYVGTDNESVRGVIATLDLVQVAALRVLCDFLISTESDEGGAQELRKLRRTLTKALRKLVDE